MTPQRALRQRLMSPPNAVPDTGINMRNGRPILKVVEPPPCTWRKPKLTLIWQWKAAEKPSFDLKQESEPLLPPGHKSPKATAIAVINETCAVWGIEQYRFFSKLRWAEVVRPRQAAMAIIRRITPLSFPRIGKCFGGMDHSTIVHADKKMARHIAALNQELTDWSTPAEWVRALKARLES